ncbi:hypothetical protein RvY_19108 [Ramazzottius varieornatus]|uniref:Uncharacterized protein n=1 Tax=Ramazzottius varieornatus TaxID=947166 RepID=A0A1D1W896_RAMVA|nr:hypothetical protein RvY_19108 [Ramazzottius varieornatus]
MAQVTSAADSQLNEDDQFFLDPKESVKRDAWNFGACRKAAIRHCTALRRMF